MSPPPGSQPGGQRRSVPKGLPWWGCRLLPPEPSPAAVGAALGRQSMFEWSAVNQGPSRRLSRRRQAGSGGGQRPQGPRSVQIWAAGSLGRGGKGGRRWGGRSPPPPPPLCEGEGAEQLVPTKRNLAYFIFFPANCDKPGQLEAWGGLRAGLSLGARVWQPLMRCGVSLSPPNSSEGPRAQPGAACVPAGERGGCLLLPRPSAGHGSDPPGGGRSGGERGCSDLSFMSPSQILPSARGRRGETSLPAAI